MLGLAYIGNGKSTNRYHLPFVLQLPDLFCVRQIFARSRPTWPLVDGVVYTDDLETIWRDSKVDVVVITTPLSAHFDLAKLALEHG